MKKMVAFLMALCMLFAAGASAMAETSEDFEPAPYVIGSMYPSAGIPYIEVLAGNLEQIAALTNGEVYYGSFEYTADGVINMVEQHIAAGVNGLIITPPADSILPTITQLCEEAGVYWGTTLRSIEDDDIRAMVEASEYYVGGCNEDEELVGRLLMTELHELGYDQIAIISTAKGDMSGDRREAGMMEVADEYGMEIVAEVRGLMQDAEVTTAVESFLAAYPDLDAIVCVASVVRATSAAIKVLEENDSDVMYVTVDLPSTDVQYIFASDNFLFTSLVANGAGTPFDYYMSIIKLVNAIQGYKITNEAGEIELSDLSYILTYTLQEAGIAAPVYTDPSFRFFSDEYITQNLLKWNNPALTEEAIQEIIDSYNLLTMSPYYTGQ